MLLAFASFLFYFGLGMLLLVPGAPGEPYWAKERLIYGVVPLCAGLTLATAGPWIALRTHGGDEFGRLVRHHLLYAFCGIPVVFGLFCLNDLWFHIPFPRFP
jgi:hypothetical protein